MISAEHVKTHDDGLDLVGLWNIAWGRRYLIMVVTILSGLVAVVFALTAEHIYRAEVVMTQVPDSGLGAGSGGITNQLGSLAALAGVNLAGGTGPRRDAPAILRSRHLVEEFIQRFDLVPVLFPNGDGTLWLAVLKFRTEIIDIREDRRTGTTILAIDWHDPVVAARWANDFVSLANESIRGRASNDAANNLKFLNSQLDETGVMELRRVIYNLIENESKTLMLANARKEFAFTIVDPAVTPEQRISPRRRVMVMVGVILGLILGTAAAFALNAREHLRARKAA